MPSYIIQKVCGDDLRMAAIFRHAVLRQVTLRDGCVSRKKLICAVLLLMECRCSHSTEGTHDVFSVFLVPWQLRTLANCSCNVYVAVHVLRMAHDNVLQSPAFSSNGSLVQT